VANPAITFSATADRLLLKEFPVGGDPLAICESDIRET
jgi:hypothetical protein